MYNTSRMALEFENGKDVAFTFQYASDMDNSAINSLLTKILAHQDRIFLLDIYVTIIRELIENAIKANAKRVFFLKQNIDIRTPDGYREGMSEFKKIALKLDRMKDDIEKSPFYISVRFQNKEGTIRITITNNARPTEEELERIHQRVDKATRCNNFDEAYNDVYDSSEGAGLGLILTVLLQKNAGIKSRHLEITTDEKSISMTLEIPRAIQESQITSEIKDKIIDEIKTLPSFPEHILELQSLCISPEASIDEIASKISLDPSLTADVFKIANSAGFISGKRVKKINEAIMIIGLRNLNNILTVAASREILDTRYKKFRRIWDHCNQTAGYCRLIARSRGFSKYADVSFIAGLLHDIGKIVLLSIDIDTTNKIYEIAGNRNMRTSTVLEEITIAISHSTIGALIADKWNFHEELVEAIRFHHSPLQSNRAYRETVMIVYMANLFSAIELKRIDMSFFEAEVLERFNIPDMKKLEKFYRRIENKFARLN